ncbi:DUF389 domain-containing protein [Roseibium sp.]|uniref:DUF389 domain-containing protein n=1 Tax=Roseibium sp. TaxID=1936156 RepID=UPI00329A7CC0
MRHLTIVIPPNGADCVREAAAHNAIEIMAEVAAVRDGAQRMLLLCDAPNAKIEGFLAAIENVEGLYVTYAPQGVLALRPPANEPEKQVTDIQPRSPLEIFLSGLQSIGSWTGFLSYAALGGVVVWIALFTESVFLLVAAMLIAPFAGPAMTTALATARGDLYLLRRSVLRYVAALATAIAVAAGLSVIFDQKIATSLMTSVSMRSTVSVLLPLAAGAAGALNLAQSERSSLVSGAATGMLVAAALAPPAGLIGMGLVIGQMDIVYSSLWALAIQIVGINLSGFVVFRLYGVTNKGARYPRGKPAITFAALAFSMAAVVALLVVQFSSSPQFQQSSLAQRITASAQLQIEAREDVKLIVAQAAFSRARPHGENPVLLTIQVEGDLTPAQETRLAASLQTKIESEFGVQALADLTALPR